jgi:hypothetical protein
MLDKTKSKKTEQVTPVGPERYGRYYWCVKTKQSEDGEIFLRADQVDFYNDALIFIREKDGRRHVNLILAPGQWSACYAASIHDGCPVAVEHWKGEVQR